MISSRTPSAASSCGFGEDFFDRLGGMLAAHFGNGAEGAEPIAAFGDFQIGEVARRDAQARAIGKRLGRRRLKNAALFVEPADQTIGDFRDLLAAEDADDVIDLGTFFQQRFFFALRQAAGDDDAARAAAAFEIEHFVNGRIRFFAGPLDETAGVDDDEIGPLRLVDQAVAIQLQAGRAFVRCRPSFSGSRG